MNFSLVNIARNEAKTLPKLAASISDFLKQGGEWVVLDTGSTDGTAEVARSLGAKVEEVGDRFRRVISKEEAGEINAKFVVDNEEPIVKEGDSLFDFSSARNHAASLASNDMVAMPDCDEVYTKLDLDAVNKAIAEGVEQLEYHFVFAHDDQGLPTIEFMHSKFYDRRKLKWMGIVHEVLQGEAKRRFVDFIRLEHFQNHETNRSGYLKGLALDCYLHPENDRNSHYLGRELLWTGRPRSAIRELSRHVEMNKWQPERSQSLVFIGKAYESLGEGEKAVASFHEAFQTDAGRREPLICLAEHYFRQNDHQRVACYARASLEIPQSGFYADNAEHYRHVPHELLYWAYWYLGRKEESKEHWQEAFKFQPSNQKYLHDSQFYIDLPRVSILIPSLGRPVGLQKCLDSIKSLNYPQDKIDVLVLDKEEPTVPQKIAEGVEKTNGEFIVYAANDVEFTPDALKIAILSSIINKKGLVAFHSEEVYPDKGNISAHFVIRRDLIPKIGGEIFDTEFHHVGVDNLLWAKCDKLREAWHENSAKIVHNHFSKGAEFDTVYRKGWEHAEEDRAMLKRKLALI